MQVNSINFATNYGRSTNNTSFGDKGSGCFFENIIDKQNARSRSIKETIPSALETIAEVKSNINKITFENAIDYRMRIAKEAKAQLEGLKQIISRLK